MKLITLNICGGHVRGPLLEILSVNKDIDIFCFQEIYHNASNKISNDNKEVSLNIFSDIMQLLPNHRGIFKHVIKGIYGIAMLIKKNIKLLRDGEIVIHENMKYPGTGPTHQRNSQWIECRHNNQDYTIMNVHGLWNGKGKIDTPARITQSQRIKQFMKTLNTSHLLCGDFNLRPDTQSLEIIAAGSNNLIKNHSITSTRTPILKERNLQTMCSPAQKSQLIILK